MQEAKRLHFQLGMHVSDGFALAGGPWIKPGALHAAGSKH